MPSLLEAIEMKYGLEDRQIWADGEVHMDAMEENLSIFVPKRPPRMCIPSLLVLNDFDIETAGDGREIEHKCSGVEELDLAMNKLERWSEVLSIFAHMPRLKFANLSFNTLSSPLHNTDICNMEWNQLTNLVLNSTHIDWLSVRHLLRLLPGLKELHLSFNDYCTVDLEDVIYEENEECRDYDFTEMICLDTYNCSCRTSDDCHSSGVHVTKSMHKCGPKLGHTPPQPSPNLPFNALNSGDDGDSPSMQTLIYSKIFTKFDTTNGPHDSPVRTHHKKRVIHDGIKKLHFTGNLVTDWWQICKLGKSFPNLESLVLADCPIVSLTILQHQVDSESDTAINDPELVVNNVEYERTESFCESECESSPPRDTPHNNFRNLLFLNLNCTALSAWEDIERLARFPKLQCLRIQGCPLWESHETTQHERRQLMVARLPNISVLNGGGAISEEEREAAERAFIRHYTEKPEDQRPDRFNDLVRVHGHLEPLVNVDLRPEKRVKVTFIYKDITEERMVDVYRTVADLKTKLEPMTGLAATRMRLYYVDKDLKNIQGPEEMKYASKQLYSYNIQSGDEIIVDQKKRTQSSSSTTS